MAIAKIPSNKLLIITISSTYSSASNDKHCYFLTLILKQVLVAKKWERLSWKERDGKSNYVYGNII